MLPPASDATLQLTDRLHAEVTWEAAAPPPAVAAAHAPARQLRRHDGQEDASSSTPLAAPVVRSPLFEHAL